MMSEILGMAAVNASHYDGATALAEAVLMARAVKPGPVLVPAGLNPAYREVVDSYLAGPGGEATVYEGSPLAANFGTGGLSALVVQWPDFLGQLWELEGLADRVHAAGGLLIVHVDPIMLGIVRSPGSLGADIVTAEGQALGIPMSFGGPALGIMACTQALVRRLPGRLVGQALDRQGRRGFTLTLSAREQHIRREKAVSNICSNQGLMALSACVYLASLGPAGLEQVGQLCRERAWEAASRLAALPGYAVPALTAGSPVCPHFFKEFLVRTPLPAEEAVQAARRSHDVEAGLPLSRVYPAGSRPGADHELLVCATELTTAEDIEALAAALAEAGRRKP
jgi:glycine dehydrogenase subunit 1